jgi:hypothetical protein
MEKISKGKNVTKKFKMYVGNLGKGKLCNCIKCKGKKCR